MEAHKIGLHVQHVNVHILTQEENLFGHNAPKPIDIFVNIKVDYKQKIG